MSAMSDARRGRPRSPRRAVPLVIGGRPHRTKTIRALVAAGALLLVAALLVVAVGRERLTEAVADRAHHVARIARARLTSEPSAAGTMASVDALDPPAANARPPRPDTIELRVSRMDGRSAGAAVVSNGVPLAPGALFPGQRGFVRVLVRGAEVPAYVEELAARHGDGSLRAVVVQFSLPALSAASPVVGALVLGPETRPAADVLAAPLVPPAARTAMPQAAALPADPAYLSRTDLFESTPQAPLQSVAQVKSLGGAFAAYESNFATYAEQHWAAEGPAWENDYYDRANIYYAWWARTGNGEYWRRATLMAVAYRHDYLEKNDYGASPHWAQLEGLEKHYLLTGDPASRFAVARVAEVMESAFHRFLPRLEGDWMDGRIQTRVLQAYFLAWRLRAQGQRTLDYAKLMDDGLTLTLSTQAADGAYRFKQQCHLTQNFMTGMLNDQLIRQYTYYKADPRIPVAVKKATDFMWTTQWDAKARAFKYLERDCPGQGDAKPAADLNGFVLTSFGWLYRRLGDERYLEAGDQVLAGGVAGAWLSGSKQFNESYTSSFRYFGFRVPLAAATTSARDAAP